MPDAFFITLAYVLTWLVVIAYAVYVARRVRRARERLAAGSERPEPTIDPDPGAGGWTP